MAKIELKNISKIYNEKVKAVKNASITIEDKEFVVFVGPSGCGKSTTLRMVAGLEEISEGELFIDGKKMNDIAPKDRDIAMVFQNYALYPHMSVYDNMSFALRIQKVNKQEIERRVKESARILDIEDLLKRKPKALSGGQRQRVAVGRAIVRNPKVFLFDEPLSNLDAKLRVQMRMEISNLHKKLEATIIYVTHDQVEAMTMGDKIVVMKDGIVQQIGSPLDLYHHPANKFVAGFIGTPPMNFLKAEVSSKGNDFWLSSDSFLLPVYTKEHKEKLKSFVDKEIFLGIRPEDMQITEAAKDSESIVATVVLKEILGAETLLHVKHGEQELVVRIFSDFDKQIGDNVKIKPNMQKAKFFDSSSGKAILE